MPLESTIPLMSEEIDVNSILAIFALMGAAASFVANRYRGMMKTNAAIASVKHSAEQQVIEARRDLCASIDNMRDEVVHRLTKVEQDLIAHETRFNIFWKVVEEQLPKMLMRPEHKEMDSLLEKVKEGTITVEEAKHLKDMMRKELDEGLHKTDSSKALAYIFMLARLEAKILGV